MRYQVWMPQSVDAQRAAWMGEYPDFPAAYMAVGAITADSLEAAWVAGQNDFTAGGWNAERPTRSLSVGDVLSAVGNLQVAWRVESIGFRAVDRLGSHFLED